MFATDQSIDSLKKLYAEFRRYLALQREYALLELTEKLGILLSMLIVLLLVVVLCLVALFYLSFMVVSLLSSVVGPVCSFGLVAAFHVVLVAVILLFRHRLIYAPVVRFMAHLLLDDSSAGEEKDPHNTAS